MWGQANVYWIFLRHGLQNRNDMSLSSIEVLACGLNLVSTPNAQRLQI